jgi:hypothetical protein
MENFHKPIFLTLASLLGFSLYFPFCGLPVSSISKDLCLRCIVIGALQLMNFVAFMYSMEYLPISTAIIVRVKSPTDF